jgi:hypothetical protein
MLDLSLVDSDFSSEIPIELGQLRLLSNLSLLGNKLTGTFPTEIGNLLNLGKAIVTFLCHPLHLLF